MLTVAPTRTRTRSLIAIVAAYAFVLQAMLSGVALSQMAAAVASDLPVVLCASGHAADDATGGSQQSGKVIACAACALCAVSGALAPPPPIAHAAPLPVVIGAALITHAQSSPLAARPAGPRLSQGPPRIA